ncbi:hypothetical protein CP532_1358 [Ophiocordyceps camponoti-leonardi (nom. inval.)]|nr:hypothetical protein CP532_1358 [Ophiocordyceps camponoti-leonardi (nom. inval.)]
MPFSSTAFQNPPPKLYAWSAANIEPSSSSSPPLPENPKGSRGREIFIVGGGNIGRLFAVSLARLPSSPSVTLVLNSFEKLKDYTSSGIRIVTPPSANFTSAPISLEYWTTNPPPSGPIRHPPPLLETVIVATKVTDAVEATLNLRGHLGARSVVAMAQNGFCPFWSPGGEEILERGWGSVGDAPTFMACVVSHGLYADAALSGTSVHASVGDVLFGPVSSESTVPEDSSCSYLTDSLLRAPLLNAKAIAPTTLWLSQLEKLVYNSTINPLTALLRCPNGALISTPTRSLVIDNLLTETSQILQPFIKHRNPFPSSETLISPASFSQRSLRAKLQSFIPRVARNRSSMLQHVTAGQPTEIRAFNGWLVDRAAELDPGFEPVLHRRLVWFVEGAGPDDEPWDDEVLRRRLLS